MINIVEEIVFLKQIRQNIMQAAFHTQVGEHARIELRDVYRDIEKRLKKMELELDTQYDELYKAMDKEELLK